MSAGAATTPPRISALWAPVYLPAAIYSLGLGATLPVLPVIATDYGAGIGEASVIAGLFVVGRLVGNVPAAWLVDRAGEKWAMIGAAAATAVAAGVALAVPDVVVLGICVALIGSVGAVYNLARHALLTRLAPAGHRGRAIATLAGMNRAGMTAGPLLTAALVLVAGVSSAFWLQIGMCVAAAALLLVVADPAELLDDADDTGAADAERSTPWAAFARHREVLLRVGTPSAILMMLRDSRTIILPLWGVAIGVAHENIALAVGLAGVLELALCYASGQLMDRFGRVAVAVPVTAGMALGHAVLLLAHDTLSFVLVAVVLGLANSLGSGITMTLGADLAPPGNPSAFLGAWRLVNDAGSAVAPVVISTATLLVAPAAAAVVLTGVGLAGAWAAWRQIPRYLDRPKGRQA